MDYNNGNYNKRQEQEIQESFAKELFKYIEQTNASTPCAQEQPYASPNFKEFSCHKM